MIERSLFKPNANREFWCSRTPINGKSPFFILLAEKLLFIKEMTKMRNGRRTLALVLTVLLLAALLGACGAVVETSPDISQQPEGSAEPVMGGDLTVGIAQDLDKTLDPHKMVYAGTREVLFNVYEGLVKPDTDGNLVPAVAKDFGISDDGTVFTFTLRENVKFHNGDTVTADDVVYSLKRAAGTNSDKPLVEGFEAIKSIEKTDDSTVVVTLSEPNVEFLAQFAVAIIPDGSNPEDGIIGTGPFKYVSRTPQENVVLEKFDDYWGTPAYVDGVTFKIIEEGEALIMSLKSGALDLVAHLSSAQTNQLGDDYTIVEGTMNLVQALYLNNKAKPFDNMKVRQALCYALDRKYVMDLTADGRGAAVGSSMYPAFTKYFRKDLVDYYSYDIEKAKQLLAEAGYEDGFEFDVTVPSNYQPHVDTATVLSEQLSKIGVTMNVKLVDWNTWVNDTYLGRNFEGTVIGVDASLMTARSMLERFTSDNASNFINFSNEEYDEVFSKAVTCIDSDKQVELYGRLQEILAEQAANVYIQDLCDMVAMGNGVRGYEFYPLYVMDMSKVYFTK